MIPFLLGVYVGGAILLPLTVRLSDPDPSNTIADHVVAGLLWPLAIAVGLTCELQAYQINRRFKKR